MYSLTTALLGFGALVSAAPFTFQNNPLGNSFPNPNPSQLLDIERAAHGSIPIPFPPIPGAPAAKAPAASTVTSLKLVAFNELFEAAFFTELVWNITNNVPGYIFDNQVDTRSYILSALTAIQAQEELHAINANNAVKKFTGNVILPCQYDFPVNNIEEAIALASTFTDVVLGTLGDIQTLFGADGDAGLIRGVASTLGQEGEQNGFFRNLMDKIPSALPFLTASTRQFAFSALQSFVVPGTCPNITATHSDIALPIFSPLTVLTPAIKPEYQTLSFSFQIPSTGVMPQWKGNWSGLQLVYVNQQNAPTVEKLQNVKVSGSTVTFDALFPFDAALFGNGLTIAVITDVATFSDVDAIAAHTFFGPGLIEIN